MSTRTIMIWMVSDYKQYLYEEEKSKATIEKYMRDIRSFMMFASDKPIDKNLVIAYKNSLEEQYAITSINSMLAAVNGFLIYHGWHDCKVKQIKTQRRSFRNEEKELTSIEYKKLLFESKRKGKKRLNIIMQTITNTGIRISELSYITAEAVRRGYAEVNCKGKARIILISKELQKMLFSYMNGNKIAQGHVFVSKQGNPLDRSNIWREMKALCKSAGIDSKKVFPHNLRHLFACTFYSIEKDLAKLADVLGHSNIETTRIYTMTSGKEHRKTMSALQLLVL